MIVAVIAGGPDVDPQIAYEVAQGADKIICADSGADIALRAGLKIDRVMGDLDSISPEAKAYIEEHKIPVEVFPVQKDMTDTELALRELSTEDEIRLICSLAGRPDHMIANILLLTKLKSEGYDITLTDGTSDVIPMAGPDSISIEGLSTEVPLNISLIPLNFDEKVSGVTTKGLFYELSDATLEAGSTYSVSNSLKEGEDSFEITIKAGKMAVIITPL